MTTAAILSIGTELVRGEIVDTNASWLGDRLAELGVEVAAADTVPDEPSRIEAALRRLGAAYDLVVATGGLGPTSDDLTAEAVARVLGVPLERDPEQMARIGAFFAERSRKPSPSNFKQADLPRGARPLPNGCGTAPGFAVRIGRARAFFLPGVPVEMFAMFTEQVEPELSALPRARLELVRLRIFGLPESLVNDRLSDLEGSHGVTLGYRVDFPELEIKVMSWADEHAHERVRAAADEVRLRLGPEVVLGEGRVSLPALVGDLLRERGLTLALAESCTGGWTAKLLTDAAGASDFFLGSAVTYANPAKRDLLRVPEALLVQHGAVSAEVARCMAEGARAAFGSALGLSLTGIAGPGGGSPVKPVGLVYAAAATAEGSTVEELRLGGGRDRIRCLAAFSGLALLRRVVVYGLGSHTP